MLIATVFSLACLWLLITGPRHVNGLYRPPFAVSPERLAYSREYLLELGRREPLTAAQISPLTDNIPLELLHGHKRRRIRRKRGSRGGIRNRLRRRGSRLPLPAITLSNVRSLRNKTEELSTLIQFDQDYRQTSLFCFTETWLTEDTEFYLDSFKIIRFDRDAARTRKSIGGGLCMAVSNSWATNVTVRETVCCKHYELMTVSFRPHYLPREFSQITVILAYVPGPDFNLAAEHLSDYYNRAVNQTGEQPVFLLGDFNRCDVTTHLPDLEQYVTTPTRKQSILDMCYGNIPGAYISKPRPPLGRSDHNVILLLPTYRSKLKTGETITKTIRVWNDETTEALKGCFELTDWDLFFDTHGNDLNMLTDVLTSYFSFCEDTVTQTKQITIHPNNKKWVTRDMKICLVQKKAAFLQGDTLRVRELEKEFRRMARLSKISYKNKVEQKLTSGNAREAWQGLNIMMDRVAKPVVASRPDPAPFAEQLNTFFARFNNNSPSDFDCSTTISPHPAININEQQVTSILRRVKPHKASGPDKLRGRVLKDCSAQLGGVVTRLFQCLLDSGNVPNNWKESTIIPIPKKTPAKELKDYRPVALTSVLCKCMERVLCDLLAKMLSHKMDPLQFAYRAKRGVEDASLTLLNTVTKHLDSPHPHTRILFMDFSSAFNTVHIDTLLYALLDLQVHPTLVLWIKNFLNDRPQQVLLNGFKSKKLILNTGVPQGCVLSPVLFSVYTNNITCNSEGISLFKYADDMALVAHLTDTTALDRYQQAVENLAQTFNQLCLELNVQKTKELCCGGRRESATALFKPLSIQGQLVEQVESFKYLGTDLDNCLSFSQHADTIFKKSQQRLYLLRKLRTFNVSTHVLTLVYQSLIESLLTFNISSWYSLLSSKHKTKLSRTVNQASKIIGAPQTPLSELYSRSVIRKATLITEDSSHPLHHCFQLLPSGKRHKVPLARKNIYKKSFIPSAITILNNKK